MLEFRNDDYSYICWIADHPEGYVLNLRATPDSSYVVLHRASCGSISSTKGEPGGYTERSYRKVCATSVEELRSAARREGRTDGSFSKVCSHCCSEEEISTASLQAQSVTPTQPHGGPSFAVKLGKAYWTQGFFNVGVAYDRYFGKDNSRVEILLGPGSSSVVGYINRRANPNQTPRVMGGALVRNWIQRNSRIGKSIQVEVLAEDRIRLLS